MMMMDTMLCRRSEFIAIRLIGFLLGCEEWWGISMEKRPSISAGWSKYDFQRFSSLWGQSGALSRTSEFENVVDTRTPHHHHGKHNCSRRRPDPWCKSSGLSLEFLTDQPQLHRSCQGLVSSFFFWQFLVEKVIRARIYESSFWKEHCFALTGRPNLESNPCSGNPVFLTSKAFIAPYSWILDWQGDWTQEHWWRLRQSETNRIHVPAPKAAANSTREGDFSGVSSCRWVQVSAIFKVIKLLLRNLSPPMSLLLVNHLLTNPV